MGPLGWVDRIIQETEPTDPHSKISKRVNVDYLTKTFLLAVIFRRSDCTFFFILGGFEVAPNLQSYSRV